MGAVVINSACVALVIALSFVSGQTKAGPTEARNSASLFVQSAATKLDAEISRADVSFLLIDTQTGDLLTSRWDNPERPIPVGSLVKPFIALAYGEQHVFRYPTHVCRGTATGCWLPRGHGDVDLTSAIAHSCNSYFRALTAGMTAAEISPIATRIGLQIPSDDLRGAELVGIGNRWSIAPINLARGYLELLRRRDQPGVQEILAGMAAAAEEGTGAAVNRALAYPKALVKTGTAGCTHARHAPGDGFAIALFPAEHPEILLLVRVHGVPGAEAARTAGEMLRKIGE
jgi:cell division protein FtsI/penicillin-binding protein 2